MNRRSVTCLLAFSMSVFWAGVAHASPISNVVTFNPALGELPESITVDGRGNLYVSVAGSVRKVDAHHDISTIATLPIPAGANANGIKIGPDGFIYVVSNSFSPSPSAAFVWRVSLAGAVEQFAALDPNGFPNDLVFDDDGNLYVTDSFLGEIFKIDPHRTVSVWLSDPLFDGNPVNPVVPIHDLGINGLAFDKKKKNLYLVNMDFGEILRVPIRHAGHPGSVELVAADPLLRGGDGIAFDVKENLYIGVNFGDRIAVLDKHGHIDVVAQGTALDGPSSVAFGTGCDDHTLYVTNFAIGRALGIVPGTPNPGIVSLPVPHPGLPLP